MRYGYIFMFLTENGSMNGMLEEIILQNPIRVNQETLDTLHLLICF